MSCSGFVRGWGTLGFGKDSFFPDESLYIGTEFICHLAKGKLEVVGREGNVVFCHFHMFLNLLL